MAKTHSTRKTSVRSPEVPKKTETKPAASHNDWTDALSNLADLERSQPRRARVVIDLIARMSGEEQNVNYLGNYLPFTFISRDEKEKLFNIWRAVRDLHRLCELDDDNAQPAGILVFLEKELSTLDADLHDRFLEHRDSEVQNGGAR